VAAKLKTKKQNKTKTNKKKTQTKNKKTKTKKGGGGGSAFRLGYIYILGFVKPMGISLAKKGLDKFCVFKFACYACLQW